VTASTTTTIRGVSIFSRQRKRKADVFDIALSPEGIAIQRPGRSEQHMTWDRIAHWEIVEKPGCVVLTLRGGGSVTPLQVNGWTVPDLETVMREAAAGRAGTTGPAVESEPVRNETPATSPVEPRVARRQATRGPRRHFWKVLVTMVLLGALATAVTVVLLQSAGVISWSFLGPVG
jgi:hypothetical protein